MSRWLIIFGVVLIAAGLLWPVVQKLGLGRLPGDIVIERETFHFYFPGAVWNMVENAVMASPAGLRVADQAARSMTVSVGLVASVGQPLTLRMVICPEASRAQNSMAAVSGDGSTVCVLIRRLNSSCSRSTALVVRAERHWPGGRRVKVNSRSPASSRLSATARHFSRHLRRNAVRRSPTSFGVAA